MLNYCSPDVNGFIGKNDYIKRREQRAYFDLNKTGI
jgi:hypothetical protein